MHVCLTFDYKREYLISKRRIRWSGAGATRGDTNDIFGPNFLDLRKIQQMFHSLQKEIDLSSKRRIR
jgi:hypothetical protein